MENLQQVQEKLFEKKRLEAKLSVLRSQNRSLELQISGLKRELESQQEDVLRLERVSLSGIFYSLIGQKEDRLDKEKAEAYSAKLKYDTAVLEQKQVFGQIQDMEEQLRGLASIENRYAQLLHEKTQQIRNSGTPQGEELLELESRITEKQAQKKEISEAIFAGNRAMNTVNKILSDLSDAEGWGIWDLAGGGLVSDLIKHSCLDEAQEKVQKLQEELLRFRTELADVSVDAQLQVNVDGFLRFADYFFDGLFADWAVLDHINDSQGEVTKVQCQVRQLLSDLTTRMNGINDTIAQLEQEKEKMVVNASV